MAPHSLGLGFPSLLLWAEVLVLPEQPGPRRCSFCGQEEANTGNRITVLSFWTEGYVCHSRV